MARRAIQPPEILQRRAFTVAEALDAGLTRRTLDHHRFVRPHWGVCEIAVEAADTPDLQEYVEEIMLHRARSYRPLLRANEAFSHTTALMLLGAPIHAPPDVHVTIARPAGQARSHGVFGHRSSIQLSTVTGRGGMPCIEPTTALTQVAATLSFRELVVAIDSFVKPRRSTRGTLQQFSLDELRAAAQAAQGSGIRRYRVALDLARVGAESRMETLLRLELIAIGHDDLELQANIHDDYGVWIGRFDLADRAKKRLVEYDGEQHQFNRAQYLKDQRRLDRAWAAGYQVLRLVREDFAPGKHDSTRRRLCEFLGREPHPISAELRKYLAP